MSRKFLYIFLSFVILSLGNAIFSLPAHASYLPFNTSVNMNVGIGTSTPQGAFVVTNGNVGIGTWVPGGSLIVNGGNVGIGTNTPPNLLYVAGTGEMQGFKLDSNGVGSGYVLTSTAVGVGTWMPSNRSSQSAICRRYQRMQGFKLDSNGVGSGYVLTVLPLV